MTVSLEFGPHGRAVGGNGNVRAIGMGLAVGSCSILAILATQRDGHHGGIQPHADLLETGHIHQH